MYTTGADGQQSRIIHADEAAKEGGRRLRDLSHFIRMFRRRFDATPSDLRQTPRDRHRQEREIIVNGNGRDMVINGGDPATSRPQQRLDQTQKPPQSVEAAFGRIVGLGD